MAVPKETFSFIHSLDVDELDRNLDLFMKKIFSHGSNRIARLLIPSLIHIDMPSRISQRDVPTFRKLIKGLRKLHHNYFVRFSMPLLWVMESDSMDIFYARENSEGHFSDVILKPNVTMANHLEIKTLIPSVTDTHHLLRSLSTSMIKEMPILNGTDIDDRCYKTMCNFHRHTKLAIKLREKSESCYILMIPSMTMTGYNAIPLWGVDIEDAKRKFKASQKNFVFLSAVHNDTLQKIPDSQAGIGHLFDECYSTLEDIDRSNSAKEIYDIAELLLGHYAASREKRGRSLSRHAIILFNMSPNISALDPHRDALQDQLFDPTDSYVDVYTLDMRSVNVY